MWLSLSEKLAQNQKKKYLCAANKASSEAATGPGICVSKYGKAKRSPLPPQWGTGGGIYNEIWCNGSTTDFGSVCPSSNLGISTTKARHPPGFFASNTKRLYKVKNTPHDTTQHDAPMAIQQQRHVNNTPSGHSRCFVFDRQF